jgi:predicted DNA-binding transcriptional regulator AlpA
MHVDEISTTSPSPRPPRRNQHTGHRSQTDEAPHSHAEAARSPSIVTKERLPDRLVTATEVAAFVGCHEESVRRAYLCGQLKRQRFGVRSWRFHPADVMDWIARGAPTRIT